MKSFSLFLVYIFSLLSVAFSCQADVVYNPSPAKIESSHDDADAALKRLTVGSENKTPTVKNLDAAWIKSLAERGQPTLYTKANSHDFDYIGMPVGGIGAGEIYLSGDGRLWDWDIFGTLVRSGFQVENGEAYRFPHRVGDIHDQSQQVLDQGFVIRARQGPRPILGRLIKTASPTSRSRASIPLAPSIIRIRLVPSGSIWRHSLPSFLPTWRIPVIRR